MWALDYKTSSEISARYFENFHRCPQAISYALALAMTIGRPVTGFIVEAIRSSKKNRENMFNLTFEELTIIGLSLAVIEILGIVCAIHSILHSRTSQGAIAWAVSLITVPVITLPLYAFFGRHKFDEYQRSLRERNISLQRELKPYHSHWVACSDDVVGNNFFVRTMKNLSGQEFTKGNSIDLLVNGENTFQAIFDAIDNAREYVLIEFFIIKDDALGNDLKQRLINCQNRGVKVYFLYDSIGSYSLSRGYLDSLKDAGVEVSAFGSPNRFKNRYQLNFRNHRKIVIVDGLVGFAGGHNVGEEYLGRKKRYGFWRDTHIRLSGPAVMSLQEVFLENWYWVTTETPKLHWSPETSVQDMAVMVVPTGPGDDQETCSLFFVHLLNSSKERVWITSPYFVPNEAVLEALKLAALRGVDVRIIIPKKPDKWTVWFAAFAYMDESITAGVKFYRYQRGFLHQKVILVDNNLSVVGTANLDNRSFRLNFELSVLVNDEGFATQVEHMLEDDFNYCHEVAREEVTSKNLLNRVAIAGSRLLSPIL